jgi:hypothetical protein
MITPLMPKAALATVAAIAMYASTLGLPMLGSCNGVAGAAPSPSCGGDLRECLRLSAKTDIYGARYVTADDVAKCMETFDACIHGTLGGGNANPPTSTPAGGNSRKGLPTHVGIDSEGSVSDCRITGDTVTCTESLKSPPDWLDSYSGTVSGTLSGMTMTGTWTAHMVSHPPCVMTDEGSGPATYVFSPDGTVTARVGPIQWQRTTGFGCSNTDPRTSPAAEVTGTWAAIE